MEQSYQESTLLQIVESLVMQPEIVIGDLEEREAHQIHMMQTKCVYAILLMMLDQPFRCAQLEMSEAASENQSC